MSARARACPRVRRFFFLPRGLVRARYAGEFHWPRTSAPRFDPAYSTDGLAFRDPAYPYNDDDVGTRDGGSASGSGSGGSGSSGSDGGNTAVGLFGARIGRSRKRFLQSRDKLTVRE